MGQNVTGPAVHPKIKGKAKGTHFVEEHRAFCRWDWTTLYHHSQQILTVTVTLSSKNFISF